MNLDRAADSARADAPLQAVVVEVESHVAEAGWDQPPQLFSLVETEQLLREQPQLTATMGLVAGIPGTLTPVQQEPLGDGPLDEQLGALVFGREVLGVILVREVLVLPPAAEASLAEVDDAAAAAVGHPDRREVRLVVGVVRDGGRACVLRLRGTDGDADERLGGPDLAPALADALLATLDVDS